MSIPEKVFPVGADDGEEPSLVLLEGGTAIRIGDRWGNIIEFDTCYLVPLADALLGVHVYRGRMNGTRSR